MPEFAEPMARLIAELKKLPGIGSKNAQRLAFHILRSEGEEAGALAAAIRDVKENLHLCSRCNNITDVDPCVYCSSPTRNLRLSSLLVEVQCPSCPCCCRKVCHLLNRYAIHVPFLSLGVTTEYAG